MAIRKSKEEAFVIDGDRELWLQRCQMALEQGGFSDIKVSAALWQLQAQYRKLTIWGSIDITLLPVSEGQTNITVAVTSNVDNIYALFRSPGRKILEAFKEGLPLRYLRDVGAAASAATGGLWSRR
jgi:hypothetical protein